MRGRGESFIFARGNFSSSLVSRFCQVLVVEASKSTGPCGMGTSPDQDMCRVDKELRYPVSRSFGQDASDGTQSCRTSFLTASSLRPMYHHAATTRLPVFP